ncbi:hypothetical protein K7432_010615 [Basidiobolus ranarum]
MRGRPKKKVTFDDHDLVFELRPHRRTRKSQDLEVVVVSDDEGIDEVQPPSSNPPSTETSKEVVSTPIEERLHNWKYSGPDMCCICLDENSTQSNDELVWCDGDYCEVSVHRTCYGLGPIPKDRNWYCDRCASNTDDVVTCLLCPSLVGAFWRVQDVPDGWVHVICAMWIIPTDINVEYARDRLKINEILGKSWQTKCCVCDEAEAVQGISIKCEAGKCRNCLHVTCAYDYGLYDTWNDIGATTVLCKKHTKDPVRLNIWKLWVNQRDRMLDQFPGIYCRSHYQNLDLLCIGSVQRNIAELTCENAVLEKSLRTQKQKSRRLEESINRFTEELQGAEQELGSLQKILLRSFRGLQISDQLLKELELSEENVINYFLTEVSACGLQPTISKFLEQNRYNKVSDICIDDENIPVKEEFDNETFWEELFGNSPDRNSLERITEPSNNTHVRRKTEKIKCSICFKLSIPFTISEEMQPVNPGQGKAWNTMQETYGFVNNTVINRQYRRLILLECSSCRRYFHMLCLKPTIQRDLTEEELRIWKCNGCL